MTPSDWTEWACLAGLAVVALAYAAAVGRAVRKAPTVREDRCVDRRLLLWDGECGGPCRLDERGRAPCAAEEEA